VTTAVGSEDPRKIVDDALNVSRVGEIEPAASCVIINNNPLLTIPA